MVKGRWQPPFNSVSTNRNSWISGKIDLVYILRPVEDTQCFSLTLSLSLQVVSTLTITNLRVADSGSYYCNVSTSEGERYNVSKSAQVTVTGMLISIIA